MIDYETSNQWEYSYSKLPLTTVATIPKVKVKNNENENDILSEGTLQIEANTNSNGNHPKKLWYSKEFLVQFGISVVANFLAFIAGMHTGWVPPTILKLSSNDSEISLSSTEISWLAFAVPFGGGIGPIFGAILASKFGRKNAILLTTIPEIFTWIANIFAKDVYWLCVTQFIRGITGGAAFAIIPMYIGEISSPQFRGIMGFLFIFGFHGGVLFELMLVPYVTVSLNASIALIIPIFLVLIFIWMPESPYYFLMKNQPEKAGKSLRILKQNKNIDKQLQNLQQIVEAEQNEVKIFTEIFRAKNNRVSFILCLGVISIQPLTGLVPVVAYTQLTLEKSNSPIDPSIGGIIIQAVGFISIFMAFFVIDSYGRRPLLLLATFGTIIPFLLIAVYFHLDYIKYEHISSLSLLPFIGLILHQVTIHFGISAIPYIYVSESFSTNFKSFASLFVCCYGSIMNSLYTKIYPDLCDFMGIYGVYYLLALGCVVSGIGTYFFVPETKGKTLHEIQKFLKKY